MAGTPLEFTSKVDAWVAATEARMNAVFRESAKRVISIMQTPVGAGGNMPIDTGFLRASIRASLSQMPKIEAGSFPPDGAKPGSVSYQDSTVVLTIAGARIGQTIYVGYTAAYAGYQENRRGFVRLAAMQWPAVVSSVVDELKGRAGHPA